MRFMKFEKEPVTVVDAVEVVDTLETMDSPMIDLEKTKNELMTTVDKQELVALTDQIDLTDLNSIIVFGKDAAEGISSCSDSVLNMVEMDKLNQTSDMMKALTKIMEQFDPKELADTDEKKGVLSKLFNNAKSQLEKILDKYDTMGKQVDKIYVELRKYEGEITDSNTRLDELFDANIEFYKQLEKYIMACQMGYEMIDEYKANLEKRYAETGDNTIKFQIQNVEMGKQQLEQRENDLRIAENIALQSIPMLKQMQFSNLNLVRKINSAFIITLPVFKQSLAQAVLLKRQKIQADSMAALDAKTNEMLIKNAENAANQARLTTQLTTGSSIKIETLQQSWDTIMKGAADCQKIAAENAKKRDQDRAKLEQFKNKILIETQGK